MTGPSRLWKAGKTKRRGVALQSPYGLLPRNAAAPSPTPRPGTRPPSKSVLPSFVVAGSGEAPEGKGSYGDFIVRPGDTSPDGMREKARSVLGEMERRMGLLGFAWKDTSAVQVYTVFDIHPLLADEIVRRGAAEHGLAWHYCRPPVVGLDYEMDCRGVPLERVVL